MADSKNKRVHCDVFCDDPILMCARKLAVKQA